MDDISFEEGIPLSMNPIPNNLKATFFNLAPLASTNFSNTQSARMKLPFSSSSSYRVFFHSMWYSQEASKMCSLNELFC